MTGRLREICSHIPVSTAFADVGCDHGYCAGYVLERALAKRVYITDISADSLKKAEVLLKKYIDAGVCFPIVADGIECLPEPCTVLIAGMGGEEIIHILSSHIPEKFILQPMKNAEKVRRFLLRHGCLLTEDYTFEDGKYYDIIVGERTGGGQYSEREILYGRDNLKRPTSAFLHRIEEEIQKLTAYLSREGLSPSERESLAARREEKENILSEIKGNL